MTWILALALLFGLAVRPQETSPPTQPELEARIEGLEQQGTPEAKADADLLRQALAALQRRDAARKQAEEFRAAAAEVPGLVEGLRAELAQAPEAPAFPSPRSMGLEEREAELGRARAALGTAQAQVAELETRRAARLKRNDALPAEIAQRQKDLAALQESLLSASESGEAGSARRSLLAAQHDALLAELEMLEAERLALERRRDLAPLRMEKAQRELQRSERMTQHWQEAVTEARQRQAGEAAEEAQRLRAETMGAFPALESMALRNEELATLRSGDGGLPLRLAAAQSDLLDVREMQLEVQRRAAAFEARQRIGGLTHGRGRALRADFDWLPSKASLREAERSQERRYADAFTLQLDIEDELEELGRFERDRDRLLEELGIEAPSEELQSMVTELLSARRRLLEAIQGESRTLLDSLGELGLANTLLQAAVNELRNDIEARILWVRSIEVGFFQSLMDTPAAAANLVTEEDWTGMASAAVEQVRYDAVEAIALVALLALLLGFRSRLLRRRAHLCELVRSYRTDGLRYSVEALGLCLLQALPLPATAWALSRFAADLQNTTALGLAYSLDRLVLPLLLLELLRQILREKGFSEAHLRWPSRSVQALRKQLRWFEPLAVALAFAFLLFDRQALAGYSETLGREAFLALMIVFAVFLSRMVKRVDGPLQSSGADGPARGILDRTRRVWATLAVLLPLLCFALATLGFYYTATEFFSRFVQTLAFAAVLAFVNALLLRWLFITRRRLAVEQARERSRAKRDAEGSQEGAVEQAVAAVDEEAVDIPALDAQTRQLFRSGLTMAAVLGVYFIWASALPALQGLDRVQLWPTLALLDVPAEDRAEVLEAELALQRRAPAAGAETTSSGAEESSGTSGPSAGPVAAALPVESGASDTSLGLPAVLTLADVSLALIFALLTLIAARNLPGLLEISVLQRLPLDGGARYAVTTIVRYLIVIVGVTVVFGKMGLGWKNIQWLAAALTFGLAFGLQEIFANFVSGLIILVERPVRVGDVVTVGGTEGRVTRLRMRATTIQDWDRREFLIPNKELITGSVINWSLSDPITRVIVPVGVAYGSDTKLARRLLLDVAKKRKCVLDEPPPQAIFRSFGASSLDFELRVFIPSRDVWPEVVDQLHSAIDDAFRKASIEIAFPQRDLHLRSVPEGFLEPRPDAGGPAGPDPQPPQPPQPPEPTKAPEPTKRARGSKAPAPASDGGDGEAGSR